MDEKTLLFDLYAGGKSRENAFRQLETLLESGSDASIKLALRCLFKDPGIVSEIENEMIRLEIRAQNRRLRRFLQEKLEALNIPKPDFFRQQAKRAAREALENLEVRVRSNNYQHDDYPLPQSLIFNGLWEYIAQFQHTEGFRQLEQVLQATKFDEMCGKAWGEVSKTSEVEPFQKTEIQDLLLAEANELTQIAVSDTFTGRLYQEIIEGNYEPQRSGIGTWLFGWAKWRLFSKIRSFIRDKLRGEGPIPPWFWMLPKVCALFATMDEDCRKILQDHYRDNRKYTEIAEETGLSETSLRVKAHRCCKKYGLGFGKLGS